MLFVFAAESQLKLALACVKETVRSKGVEELAPVSNAISVECARSQRDSYLFPS